MSQIKLEDLVTGKDIMSALEVSRSTIQEFEKSGIISSIGTMGTANVYPKSQLDSLLKAKSNPIPEDGVQCLIVRSGAKVDHASKQAAAGPWKLVWTDDLMGTPLVMTISYLVVSVWTIQGYSFDSDGKITFELSEPSERAVADYQGRWAPFGRGPVTRFYPMLKVER